MWQAAPAWGRGRGVPWHRAGLAGLPKCGGRGGTAGWLGGASSPSWVMPATLGAVCSASEAGRVPKVGQRWCQSRAGWHCLGVPQSAPFPRDSWCLCQAGACHPPSRPHPKAAALAGDGAGRMGAWGGGRLLGWVAMVPSPTPHLVLPLPTLRSPSSSAEKDFNYLSGKTTIRENNSFLPPRLRLPVRG